MIDRDPYTNKTAAKWPEPQEGPGLFCSETVWFLGCVCLAGWAAIAWVAFA